METNTGRQRNKAQMEEQIKTLKQELNKMEAKRPTPRHIIIKMPKIKDKERNLKAAREKKLVTYRGIPIRLLISQKKLCRLEGIGKKYSKS